MLAVAVLVVVRIDIFPLSTQIRVDGELITAPRVFFTVDHPFHIARSHLIADFWESLESVRWVDNHQGGYPAEFFPFGVSAIVAGLHYLSLGLLSIEASYTLVVVGLYLLSAVAYWLIAQVDGVSRGAALLAFTGHVAIASTWLQGGYNELIEWGLVTNAAGSLFALLTLPVLAVAVQRGNVRWATTATSLIALSAFSNPRSLLAIVVMAGAIALHSLLFSRRRIAELTWLSAIGGLSIAVCAPLIFSLLRYRDQYYFLHFEEYGSARAMLGSTFGTLTWPIAILTLIGCLLTFRKSEHRVSQVVSVTFVVYASLTLLAAEVSWVRDLVPQLELPRLMPFQRLLMLYLAGFASIAIFRRLASGLRWFPFTYFFSVSAVVAMLIVFTTGNGPRDPGERGLREIPRTEGMAAIEIVNLRLAVEHADDIALGSSAILVLESTLSWHEQLWAPVWSDRRFYYDDWLWYWHRRHAGPYDYRVGHAYPNPSDALSQEYLTTHGIGAVVVTNGPSIAGGNVRDAAAGAAFLQHDGTFGAWDVYTVADATPIASLEGSAPDSIDISKDNERIRMSFANAEPGTILVRRNWFPRWSATVNGEAVDVRRAENGYIEVPTNGGDIEVELTYTLTTLDVVARGLSILGLATLLIGWISGTRITRRLTSRWSRSVAIAPDQSLGRRASTVHDGA